MQRGASLARRLLAATTPRRFAVPAAPPRVNKDLGAPRHECSAYKLQGRIPSMFDKKVLLWTGRFKKEQDIPEIVSIEMLYAARNKIRVQICYLMIAVSVLACMVMVVSGKKAFKQHENLTKWNLEKKAKLKEQYLKEHGDVGEKVQ
ncbi:protein FAM162A-like [Narcine bancroftii]|uniref:protein FAM162A-like n=1 Tax=Narcine bancroftii TaxID=1343680 RepID=UPI0038318DDA